MYYTQEYKTKKDKTFLVSLNWYRNAQYFIQNTVKHHFTELITPMVATLDPIETKYQVLYTYHYKNASSDLPNVTPMCSKWLNDTLQLLNKVPNDNVKFLVREIHEVGSQDKDNPRCEITISEYKDPTC